MPKQANCRVCYPTCHQVSQEAWWQLGNFPRSSPGHTQKPLVLSLCRQLIPGGAHAPQASPLGGMRHAGFNGSQVLVGLTAAGTPVE